MDDLSKLAANRVEHARARRERRRRGSGCALAGAATRGKLLDERFPMLSDAFQDAV
jgi:hypothetical protein